MRNLKFLASILLVLAGSQQASGASTGRFDCRTQSGDRLVLENTHGSDEIKTQAVLTRANSGEKTLWNLTFLPDECLFKAEWIACSNESGLFEMDRDWQSGTLILEPSLHRSGPNPIKLDLVECKSH
jgi:hypothetical protein